MRASRRGSFGAARSQADAGRRRWRRPLGRGQAAQVAPLPESCPRGQVLLEVEQALLDLRANGDQADGAVAAAAGCFEPAIAWPPVTAAATATTSAATPASQRFDLTFM